MKRILALLTGIMLVLGLSTGCSQDELRMIEMNTQVNNLTAYTATGSVHWDTNLNDLITSTTDSSDADVIRKLQDTLTREGLKDLTYTYSVDTRIPAIDVQYKDASGRPLAALRFIKDTYYLNLDGIIAIVDAQKLPELQDNKTFNALKSLKGHYLSISLAEIAQEANNPAFAEQMNQSPTAQIEFRKLVTNKFTDFIKTEMNGYNPGIVSHAADSKLGADVYGYTLKVEDVPKMTLELALYLTDHLDGLKQMVVSIATSPEFQDLSKSTPSDPEEMKKGIESSFDQLKANLADTKKQISDTLAEEKDKGTYRAQAEQYFKGTEFSSHTAQLKDGRFWTDAILKLRITNPEIPLKSLDCSVDMTITPKTSVSIDAPVDSVSFTQFNDSLPHELVFSVDDNTATYTNGLSQPQDSDATVHIGTDGKSFISLSDLPKHFRDKTFSSVNPLTVKTRVLVEGTDYIQKGDTRLLAVSVLKEAGLTVQWNEDDRTITITD